MEINIRSLLESFKIITLNLIDAVNNENINLIDELFVKRQDVIDKISALDYDANEFSRICEEYEIVNINKSLEKAMIDKQNEVKIKMFNLREQRVANKSYSDNIYKNRSYFNTKV